MNNDPIEKTPVTFTIRFGLQIPNNRAPLSITELEDQLEPIIWLIYSMLLNGVSLFEIQQRLLTSIGE